MSRDLRVALGLVALLAVTAALGPFLTQDPLAQPDLLGGALQAPSRAHWLGTDQFSRDVLARLVAGARTSLGVAALAIAIAATLGVGLGLLAGSLHGAAATLMRRIIDLALGLPRVIVLLVLVAALGGVGPIGLALLLGLTGWPAIARLVRGETLRLRHADWVLASQAIGAAPWRIYARGILPGTLPPVLVAAALGLADAILVEAGLSFLGLGIRPPAPSWGGMILEGREHLVATPWLVLAPGAALVIVALTATLLGDALRRHLQPESR
jgi:peptide/nickel transport system permease protein